MYTKLLALDIEEARVGLEAAEQRMNVNPDAHEVELEVVKAKLRIELRPDPTELVHERNFGRE